MAKQFSALSEAHCAFIAAQRIFFVGTAASGARVNLSPRGTDCLRILSPNAIAYRDLTGSGNETAAHLRVDGRMTIMLTAFEGPPNILRLYGRGTSLPRGSAGYAALLNEAFGGEEPPGTRQIIRLDFDLVQTSCGFGVPLFEYKAERETLTRWAEAKGEAGLKVYRTEKNAASIDGLTGFDPMV